MTLTRLTAQQVEQLRDDIETDLESAVSKSMKSWLSRVRRSALAAVGTPGPVLVAAASDQMPGMATVGEWWAAEVDAVLVQRVRASLIRSWNRWTDQRIEASPADAATNAYIANVRDRLVLGTHMGVTVYEDSFDRIRNSLAVSAAEGWSRKQLSQRIASELGWEKDGPYWRDQLATTDKKIDGILDAIGEPGNPAREWARLNDPKVARLRQDRNLAVKRLDAERSTWQTRSMLIARTESTGSANFGALQAFIVEGVATKLWEATADARTRPSHAAADGQEASMNMPFIVGGALLQFPCDPAGPISETAACRCTMLAGDFQENVSPTIPTP